MTWADVPAGFMSSFVGIVASCLLIAWGMLK